MIKEAVKWSAALALGGLAGYAYYYFVGCDGSCAISSSPVNSSLYGMGMAALLKWGNLRG